MNLKLNAELGKALSDQQVCEARSFLQTQKVPFQGQTAKH
jgi:hypothetical protein